MKTPDKCHKCSIIEEKMVKASIVIENILQEYLLRQDSISFMNKTVSMAQELKHCLDKGLT